MASSTKAGCYSVAQRIGEFMSINKWTLITYLVSWGIILTSIGMLHGFKATTKPFSIGMAAGTGFGLIGGLICASVFRFKNSIGGRISNQLDRIDYTTRSLFITVAVAVFMIATIRFSHIAGGVVGAIIGDHLAIKGYWRGQVVKAEKTGEEQLADLQQRVQELEAHLAPAT